LGAVCGDKTCCDTRAPRPISNAGRQRHRGADSVDTMSIGPLGDLDLDADDKDNGHHQRHSADRQYAVDRQGG
jgi:hypothetical protein